MGDAPIDARSAGRPSSSVWWLAFGRLPLTTGVRMLYPLLGVIAAGVGMSLRTAGVLAALFELAGLSAPIAGGLVDRIGARAGLATALLAFAAATATAALAPNPAVFAIGLVAMNLMIMVYENATAVWIASSTTFADRAASMGRYELSWGAGLFLGVPIAGLLALATWRLSFAFLAALALVAAALQRARLPRVSPVAHDRAIVVDALGATDALPRMALPTRAVVTLFCGFGLLCGSAQLVIVVYGVWLEDRFGLSSGAIGAVAFLVGGGDLLANIANVRLTDRLGKARSATLGAAAMAVSMLGLALASRNIVTGVVALAAVVMAFEFAFLSAKPLLTELGWRRRGLGVGIGLAMAALFRSVAAIVATILYDEHGLPGTAALGMVVAAAMAVVFRFGVVEPNGD